MSEYQYYEFRAIDQPLDEPALDELHALSSRAEITPTSFVNEYNYGDFRGNPHKLMEKYFDAFLYVANWGTHWLMFRLPRQLIDVEMASQYCGDERTVLHVKKDHVIVEFHSEDEEWGGWEEGEGRLSVLLPLRADLLARDLRCLYLGWLFSAQSRELDDDELEPPVPPGMRRLSAPLKHFANFMRIDPDLLAVAAKADPGKVEEGSSQKELAAWINTLPEGRKNKWLLGLAEGEAPHLRAELLQEFRQAQRKGEQKGRRASEAPRRTVASMLAAAEAHAEEERRRAAEREAKEEARRAKEQAAARAKYLETLAKREEEAWQEVETCMSSKLPKEYKRAVALLTDLRDLAERQGRKEEATARIAQLRTRHSRKHTLMRRLNMAGLKP